MNKLFNKIAVGIVSIAMAIGVGVAIGSGSKDARSVKAIDKSYSFAFSTMGSTGWTSSYADHTGYDDDVCKIDFKSASKQSGTVTTVPVTKAGDTTVVLTDGYVMSEVTFTLTQWSNKAKTVSLQYSTNGGTSYSAMSPAVSSSNFTLTSNSLPTGTNAVKMVQGNTSNQVGIASVSFVYSSSSTGYKVTYNPGTGSGSQVEKTNISGSYTLLNYNHQDLNYSAPQYCTFDSWSVKIGNADPVTKAAGVSIDVTANTTVTAVWADSRSPLTLSATGSSTVDAGATTPLTISATSGGSTVSGLSYTCLSSDESVATVTNAGVITGVAAGSATITISYAGDSTYQSASTTFEITVEAVSPYKGRLFRQISSSTDLVSGKEYLIGKVDGSKFLSSTQNANNRSAHALSGSVTDSTVTFENGMEVLTLGGSEGAWTLYANESSTKGYLYAASSGSNYLRTQSNNDANGQWAISISDTTASITAQGSNTHNQLKNNGDLFSCYTSGQTVVSLWKIVPEVSSYTITYDLNTGTGTAPTDSKTYTSSTIQNVNLASTSGMSKTGYTCDGWATSADGDVAYSSGETGVNLKSLGDSEEGSITLYAHWTINKYDVTYVKGEHGTGSNYVVSNISHGSSHSLVSFATTGFVADQGYAFKAWSVGGNEMNPGASITVNSNTTVTAVYATQRTLSFAANGGSGTMSSIVYGDGATVLVPDCDFEAPEGKMFSTWNDGTQDRAVGSEFTINSDVVLTAQWIDKPEETIVSTMVSDYASAHNWSNQTQYTSMVLDTNITVTVSGNANSGKYYSNDESWRMYNSENATFTLSASNGCTLASATLTFPDTDSPSVYYGEDIVASDTAVELSGTSATFTISGGKLHLTGISVTYYGGVTYTISYNSNGGSGTMEDTVGVVVADCTFTAPSGQKFDRWNTESDASGDDYDPGDIVSDDLTLYAIWTREIGTDVVMSGGTSASVVTTNSETKDAIKCGTGKAGGDMTITLKKAGITKIKVYVAGWSSDTPSVNVSISGSATISTSSISPTSDSGISGSSTTYSLNAAESTYRYEFTLTGVVVDTVITLESTSGNNRFVVWGATDLFAETFATDFLECLTCNAAGTSQPTYTGGYSWTGFKDLYNSLDFDEKKILKDATANPSSTNDVEKAVAKYDYVVGKYNKGMGMTSEYPDFINRNPSPIGNHRISIFGNSEINKNNSLMVTIIVSVISVAAIGGYFFLRKKKED